MGLWTVIPDRLQSSMCSLYKVPLQLIEQTAKGTISVMHKPVDTFNELVPGSGLNLGGKSTDQNTEKPETKDTTQQKENDEILPKIPKIPKIPQIPFGG